MPGKKNGRKQAIKVLFKKFERFITIHPPAACRQHFLRMFFDYLSLTASTGFPADFDEYLGELYDLVQLLDHAEEAVAH